MSENQKDNSNKINPYFGSFILETLTIGMYSESVSAIREYVQNAYDSLIFGIESKELRAEEARIDIFLEDNCITIRDSGLGISRSRAVDTLTSIGASTKNYKRQAGFRGIGRLAGLVLCDTLTFRTKAKGDDTETQVTFNASGIRHDLKPSNAVMFSLDQILERNIKATSQAVDDIGSHYFEVTMEDLVDAPLECTDVGSMVDYLSQVAPVPYSDDFTFAQEIRRHAGKMGERIEEIGIFVHQDEEETQVLKPYGDKYLVQHEMAPLSRIEFIKSPTGLWWGWVGRKDVPGVFRDELAKAIRVRVRNIQIDGTGVIGNIFSGLEDSPTYGRFNDWYIGEIFAKADQLIPNARRDGFEEIDEWLTAKGELSVVCKALGKEAYELSHDAQLQLQALTQKADEIYASIVSVTAKADVDILKVGPLVTDIDKLQRKVSKAYKDADRETEAALRAVEMKIVQSHKKILAAVNGGATTVSPGAILVAQKQIVQKLMEHFASEFDARTLATIRKIVDRVVGPID